MCNRFKYKKSTRISVIIEFKRMHKYLKDMIKKVITVIYL